MGRQCADRLRVQVTQALKGTALGPRRRCAWMPPPRRSLPALCFLLVLCLPWPLQILIILKEGTRGDLLLSPPIAYTLVAFKFAGVVGLGTAINLKTKPPLFMYCFLHQERRQTCRSYSILTSVTGRNGVVQHRD